MASARSATAEQNFVTAYGGVEAPHAVLAQSGSAAESLLPITTMALSSPSMAIRCFASYAATNFARRRVRPRLPTQCPRRRIRHGHESLHVTRLGGAASTGRIVESVEGLLAMSDRSGCTQERCTRGRCDHHRDNSSVHGILDHSSLFFGATTVIVRNGQRSVSGLRGNPFAVGLELESELA